ncbi:MAG TPA: prolyl aminopeptidase [Candidatus Ruania gallistercoris]|uniref:Proline iminopeptidase n=1 Tax=Candidatus Ruania gallistercoris TaxID=2838746 RepID=A0A9D2J6Q6_9MICO|nr:prolyl aminopeptidase [Candidatus Ruania gallistercoris]
MRTFYPEIEPHETGYLEVSDGHELYYEVSGNPAGKPVVFLHGGPGSGVSPAQRRVFDPERYRIVLFDQRMAGKSRPHASAPEADLRTNTTWHLVADIEVLREHLGVPAWQVFGGSWGSCLALAYAQTHPSRVSELVLRGIFTLRRTELDWMYEGPLRNVYPEAWEDYLAPVPPERRVPGRLQEAYHDLLFDPDSAVHVPAGAAWTAWENTVISLYPDPANLAKADDRQHAVSFARIENHFFVNHGWLEEGQLIRDAHLLADIPTVIVQGRYDMCTPAVSAYELARALPHAELVITPDAGHAFSEPGTLDALIRATDAFAGR